MTEEVFKKNVTSLEELYAILIKGETSSDQEAEARVTIIDILSSLEASLISAKDKNNEFIELLNSTRDMVLEWNTHNHWFRRQKSLVDIVYKVIVQAKSVVFTRTDNDISQASKIKDELASLKSELNDLRSLMSSLVQEKSAVSDFPSPDNEETKDSITEHQTKPIVKEKEEEQDTTPDPPIMLPIENEFQEIKEEPSPVIKPLIKEDKSVQEQEEDPSFQATATIQKLSEKRNPENAPENVLSQMKSIISDAEDQTKKQISSFVERLSQEKRSLQIAKGKLVPPVVPEEASKEEEPNQPEESIADQKTDDKDSLVKPSEILKQQNSIIAPQSTSGGDPYMQLLTLEAEKYRLEKAIEKNETDFQEGLKSKLEFDENIQLINKELVIIREQISSLRKQLTS